MVCAQERGGARNVSISTPWVARVAAPTSMVHDCISSTRGKGFNGLISRWGCSRLVRKLHRGLIDTSSKFGHGRFQTAEEKSKFCGGAAQKKARVAPR